MSHTFALELEDLSAELLEPGTPSLPTLESVAGGHLMSEVGASAVGSCPIYLCSCCCCC